MKPATPPRKIPRPAPRKPCAETRAETQANPQAKPRGNARPTVRAASPGPLGRAAVEFAVAWRFFTRVPLPGVPAAGPPAPLKLAHAARAFGPVGLVIGAAAGGALWLAAEAGFSPLLAALAALGLATLMTGALHEDGLADMADGLGGGATRARKLAIMKDSRIGTYGVLALVFSVVARAGVLATLAGASPMAAAVALAVAHTVSRAGLPVMMAALNPARRSGLAHGAGRPAWADALIAAAIGVLVATLVAGPALALAAAALAAVGFVAVGGLAVRQIGGLTGDVLGAAQQVAELLALAAMAGWAGGVA